jgi:hypothetical protein
MKKRAKKYLAVGGRRVQILIATTSGVLVQFDDNGLVEVVDLTDLEIVTGTPDGEVS